jgi:epoxyqueuosine reductase QueG
MDAIVALAELAKLGIIGLMQYMRQAGMTDQQIDEAYTQAKEAMSVRNPSNIPG